MDLKALFNLTYGLYLLTAKEGDRHNGCIINTAVQVANNPTRVSVSVIKGNLTHDMIISSGEFNLLSITTDAPFDMFKHFGMSSGRDVDKFNGYKDAALSSNGLFYLNKYSNAFLSLKVTETVDLGSHTLFIAEVVDGEVLSDKPSCTYAFYQSDIKASPKAETRKGYVCKVCGYVYEGEVLPDDYVCPLCKHGPEDFEYFEESK